MSLFGLSPAAFLLGALALLTALLALHLLRVRLRRVEVDTLLFFELAGSVRQPRALLGRPARWLAFLLAACALLAAWLAYADPRTGLDAPSRFVVVEPASGELLELRLREAERWVRERGLGPRGAVIGASAPPATWLASDEPLELLAARATRAAFASDALAHARAIADVAARARESDEVVWIGGSAPAHGTALALVEAPCGAPALLSWRGARWSAPPHTTDAPPIRELELEGEVASALELALEDERGAELARATLAPGPFAVRLARPAPGAAEGAAPCRLVARSGDRALGSWSIPAPRTRPHRVGLEEPLAEPIAGALRAWIDLDPRFELHEGIADAELVVSAQDAPADPRPRLVITAGVGGGPRRAELAPTAPFALSLRDRERREATALEAERGTVWVEDLVQGAALARAELSTRGARIELVEWLLEPATHGDVPLLLGGALELLAPDAEHVVLAPASGALELPAGDAGLARTGDVQALPSSGRVRFPSARASVGALELPRGSAEVAPLEDLPGASAAPATPLAELDAARAESPVRGGSGTWIAPLLALALLLCLVDAYAFHRGRLP